jgi:hypothetical protein
MMTKFKEHHPKAEKCDILLAMTMKHCVARHMFFNCPKKTSSTQCTEYEEFAKSCPIFPGGRGHKGGMKPGGGGGDHHGEHHDE